MPLVFVHGIKTREGNEYRGKVQARDELSARSPSPAGRRIPGASGFSTRTGAGSGPTSTSATPTFRKGLTRNSVPGTTCSPGSSTSAAHGRLRRQQDPGDDRPEGDALRRSRSCLWSAAAFVVPAEPDPGKHPEAAADLADFGRKALAYARANPKPRVGERGGQRPAVHRGAGRRGRDVERDPIRRLPGHSSGFGAGARVLKTLTGAAWKLRLGVGVSGPEWCAGRHGPGTEDRGDRHEQALAAAGCDKSRTSAAREAANLIDPVASMLAQGLHGAVAEGVGDVLVYVDTRGTKGNPGKIVDEVATALEAARGRREGEGWGCGPSSSSGRQPGRRDPLRRADAASCPTTPVTRSCTVGSQVALFEELHLFGSSVATDRPPDRRPRQDRATRSTYSTRRDPLGYSDSKTRVPRG